MAVSNSPIPVKTQVGLPLESDIQKINGVDVPGSSGYMPSDIVAVNGASVASGLPIDDSTPIDVAVNGDVTIDDSTPIDFNIQQVNGASVASGLPIDDSDPIAFNLAEVNGSAISSSNPVPVSISEIAGTPADQTGVNSVNDGDTQAGAFQYFQISTSFVTGTTATAEWLQVSFGRGCQFVLVKNLRTGGVDTRTAIRHGDIPQTGGTVTIEFPANTALSQLAGDNTNPTYFEVGIKNRDKNDSDDMTYNFIWST